MEKQDFLMRKWQKIGITVWLCVMLTATIGIEIRERWTWRLFGDLQQEDVVSIDIVYGNYPPYQMSKEDQTEVIDCLQQIEVSVSVVSDSFLFNIGKDGCRVIFWLAVLHMKDDSDVVLDILYPDHITLNRKAEYRCHDSNLTVQFYDICESYVDLIRAASKPILEK